MRGDRLKKLIGIGLIVALILLAAPNAYGSDPKKEIGVRIDGAEVRFDEPPIMVDGNVLVPMRGIFEHLGADVEWNSEERRIDAFKGERSIRYIIGSNDALVDGEVVPLKLAGIIRNGTTLVPLRFVAEALGAIVDWDDDNRIVTISSAPKVQAEVVAVMDGMYVDLSYKDLYARNVTERITCRYRAD